MKPIDFLCDDEDICSNASFSGGVWTCLHWYRQARGELLEGDEPCTKQNEKDCRLAKVPSYQCPNCKEEEAG